MATFSVVLIAASLILAALEATLFEPRWILAVSVAAAVYGLLSPVVAARRLFFLASASPHAALFAVAVSILLSRATSVGTPYIWALLLGLAMMYGVGYAIHRGLDTDVATSLLVAATATGSVLAIYHILTRYPLEVDIWAYIIGDPLLVTWGELVPIAIVGLLAVLAIILTYREQLCLGIDPESVKISGINTALYDWVLYTALAIATIGMLRIVGFVLEHVLILLPVAVASNVTDSSTEAAAMSVGIALAASMTGIAISILLNASPSGTIGLLLLIIYLLSLAIKRRIG